MHFCVYIINICNFIILYSEAQGGFDWQSLWKGKDKHSYPRVGEKGGR